MNENMPKLKINADGSRPPLLIIGPEGRHNSFLAAAFGDEYLERTDITLLSYDLKGVYPVDFARPSIPLPNYVEETPWLEQKFDLINQEIKKSPSVVTMFDADRVDPEIFVDLMKVLTSKDGLPKGLTAVVHASSYPDLLLRSPSILSKFQVIEYQAVENVPVITEPLHAMSPLHEYKRIAQNLTTRRNEMNPEMLTENLETLERFVDALNGVEGGPLGIEARERGMDSSVYKALALFADNSESSGLTDKIKVMFDDSKTKGSFIEREVGPLGLAPVKKSSQKREDPSVWNVGQP
jgi:hypothetical protein